MDVEDFGCADKPNIPAVFVLKSENLLLCTFAEYFIALEEIEGEFKVLYEGHTMNNSRISFATVALSEFILCTVSRVVEKRTLRTGELTGKALTETRLSGMCAYDHEHLLLADKFGDLTLSSWASLEAQTIKIVQEGLSRLKRHQNDVSYGKVHKPIFDLWPEITEDPSMHDTNASDRYQETEGFRVSEDGLEELPTAPDNLSSSSATTPTTRNKFDSGKELSIMLEEFEKSMGTSFMGHMATITTLSHLRLGDKSLCITSDKDEKIRVTNVPELWNIEAIMTGHTEFITDVIATGYPNQIISCAGDRTCRLWDISTQMQIGESLKLTGMPIRLIRTAPIDSSLTVLCAASNIVYDLKVTNSSIELVCEREFSPTVPLAISPGGDVYIDEGGRIIASRNGEEIAHFPESATALFVRYWKHDRESISTSVPEQRAKRSRHEATDHS